MSAVFTNTRSTNSGIYYILGVCNSLSFCIVNALGLFEMPSLPMYSSLPMFTHVYLCLPNLPVFTLVYPCLPMFTLVNQCLPMFTHVYQCLPCLP